MVTPATAALVQCSCCRQGPCRIWIKKLPLPVLPVSILPPKRPPGVPRRRQTTTFFSPEAICGTGCPSVFTAFLLPLRRTRPPFRATSLTWELLRQKILLRTHMLDGPRPAAWSKEDREIFRIRDELRAHMEDPDQSFYDLLGIKPSASIEDISKAFRKITRSLHPDKVAQKLKAERIAAKKAGTFIPGVNINKPPSQKEIRAAVKVAEERQSRLSLVRNILSGPERDRYDHVLRNGFPAWKGTNYYYDRYRPGLGTALFGVFFFAGGAIHYLALYMNHRRHKDFIERYIKFARDQAWGDNLDVPGIDYTSPSPPPADDDEQQQAALPVNRRQRRFEEKAARKDKGTTKIKRSAGSGTATPRETQGDRPVGPRKRVIAENGKVLVVDHSGNVYLEEQDEEGNLEQFLLDPTELKEPTFFDTAVVRLPVWAFNSTVGRALGKKPAAEDLDLVDVDSDNDPVHDTPGTDSAAEDFELLDKSTDSLGKAKSSGAQAGAKVNRRKKSKR